MVKDDIKALREALQYLNDRGDVNLNLPDLITRLDRVEENITLINPEQYREAVHHFMYFIFNFPSRYWERAFEGEPEWMRKHITDKFMELYDKYGPTEGTCKFFMELDHDKRDQLMDWVRENYTGYKFKL